MIEVSRFWGNSTRAALSLQLLEFVSIRNISLLFSVEIKSYIVEAHYLINLYTSN